MPKGQSRYHEFPDYRVDLEPNPKRVRIALGTHTIAESEHSLHVRETKHDQVVYIPREDVHMDLLERTDHETFCPFKGEACHWTIRVGDRVAENAIWSYEDPYEEVAELRECMAFYVDRIDALREG